ncbi:hypothetical protein B566_EDAN001583 [Ephemera danica]|nr:hypothetical protein B566_EDAN001583 [Ephemera danica]
MFVTTAVILLLAVSAAHGDSMARTVAVSSSCASVSAALRPLATLPITELRGDWVTLSRASFGGDENEENDSEYVIETDGNTQLPEVFDCTLHHLGNVTHNALNIFSEYFFEEPQLNTVSFSSFRTSGGQWSLVNTTEPRDQAVNLLVLEAEPKSVLVLATCHENVGVDERGPVRTEVHILSRLNNTVSSTNIRSRLLQHARELSYHRFLAAEMNQQCVHTDHTGHHPNTASRSGSIFSMLLLSPIVLHVSRF